MSREPGRGRYSNQGKVACTSTRSGRACGVNGMVSMMINPGIQSVVFDFDYTLADSSEGVIECANYALGRLGLPEATDDAIRRTIGLSLPDMLTALAGDEYAGYGDEFQRLFVECADVVLHDLNRDLRVRTVNGGYPAEKRH